MQQSTEECSKEGLNLRDIYFLICKELTYTLNSKSKGWDTAHLRMAFANDSGMNPDMLAQQLGVADFSVLLKSELMKNVVRIEYNDNGDLIYMPKEDVRVSHLVSAEDLSTNAKYAMATKQEQDKFNRANLPENRELMLEGRRRMVESLFHLGGESRPVQLMEVQQKYGELYGTPLNKEEIRKYFQRGSISKVLISYCEKEFEVSTGETTGLIFLKLRRPYTEICKMFEEIERIQEEARRAVIPHQDTRRLTGNRFRRRTDIVDPQVEWPLPPIAMDQVQGSEEDRDHENQWSHHHPEEIPNKFKL